MEHVINGKKIVQLFDKDNAVFYKVKKKKEALWKSVRNIARNVKVDF